MILGLEWKDFYERGETKYYFIDLTLKFLDFKKLQKVK